ncbi:MAG: cytochrome c biogenesis protein CcsA, partial [Eubacteriaceae bacterium]|nr:cytochrome c biogenesis protein CcsA [Eubacteriaceae bacterium]
MAAEKFLTIESMFFYGAIIGYIGASVMYFIFFIMKNEKFGVYGSVVIKGAFLFHTLALIARGIGAGRVPLTNQYEFATSFAWGIALCFIYFERKYSFRAMGTFVVPVIFIIIGYAAMQNKDVRALMPALRSYWLTIHVATAVISYGAFGVAFGVSGMYLLKERFAQDDFFKQHMPSLEKLDLISYKAISLGYIFLTLVMITGAIWAERAWGRYWAWDPKETWS